MTAWLFTFLVHSTLWCGVAWLGLRLFPGAHARLRETIWHTVLAASLITPTVHSVTSSGSAVWRLPVPTFIAGEERHAQGEPGHRDGVASVFSPSGEEAQSPGIALPAGWLNSAGTLWVVFAGGLLALYILRLGKLRRRLGEREPVADPRASGALASLSRRASLAPVPRLTESDDLGSAIALGVGTGREICVPVRALHELDEEELRALLGHEVAHHLRGDPIRLAVLNIFQAVFFFQPLFRLAAREIRCAAEELCDDWAASQVDDRFAMASCLTEVAGWVIGRDRRTPVPCIGRHRSQLEQRVRRLMSGQGSPQAPSSPWRRMSAVGVLVLAPLFAPAVAPEPEGPHEDRRAVEGARQGEHEQPREHRSPTSLEHDNDNDNNEGETHD